jgi:long-chain fatty acid transport protein
MLHAREIMRVGRRAAVAGVFCGAMLIASAARAGGIMLYEVGTADIGLASAGYGARAEDASTVFTNPAGMTRLSGTQVVGGAQVLWSNTKFSIGSGTSPELGSSDGGYMVGSEGWFPGGGGFLSYSVSPELKLGLALAGNFGLGLKYDDDWVGRYYVQQATLIGMSILPSIAYKVNDKLSLGASVNAMYGIFKNQVAINIPDALRPGVVLPVQRASGDAQLKVKDESWGWGANLGLLYEADKDTRFGLVWTSQVKLDFSDRAQFSNLGNLGASLQARGLLNPTVNVGIKVPQTLMGSFFTQLNDRWALLGSVGWQQWSKFGQVQLGLDDAANSTSLAKSIPFKDTWHLAMGARYKLSQPWSLNFGVAYDSGFQNDNQVSPLLPVNSAWRFAIGGQNRVSDTMEWGVSGELQYGGSLDTSIQSQVPVAAGGRGNLVGSYDNIWTVLVSAYGSWKF